jgi:hypothetical protein
MSDLVFCVVLSSDGTGIVTGWSLVHGVLPKMELIHNFHNFRSISELELVTAPNLRGRCCC